MAPMQVWPKNQATRNVLKHASGVGFREDGPAEWPDDPFTHRTIADGDVLTEDPGAGAQSAQAPEAPPAPAPEAPPPEEQTAKKGRSRE
jgi:hypothetical protein